MDRGHCIRCVIAAISAGGKPIDNYAARYLLRSKCGVEVSAGNIIRDGPIRPVWGDDGNYYIPYRLGRVQQEAKSGAWVDEITKEEQRCAEIAR